MSEQILEQVADGQEGSPFAPPLEPVRRSSKVQLVRASLAVSSLRVLTLLSKFVLTFFLSKALLTENLGVYAIMITTVAIVINVLGMEFYIFNLRELPGRTPFEQACRLRDQIIFQFICYLVILPLCLLLFRFKVLPWWSIVWFYALTISENISQEGYKVLLALSHPLAANFVLFLRTAAWIYFLLGYIWIFHHPVTLNQVWIAWLCGGVSSLILLWYLLASMPWRKAFSTPINWSKMLSGVKVSWIYMAILLSYLLTFYSGRYLLQAFGGEHMVGIFFFYLSITAVVQTFTEAGAYVILQPKLIAAHRAGARQEYKHLFRQLAAGIAATSVIAAAAVLIGSGTILSFMNKPDFSRYYHLLPLLLVAVVIQCLSLIPHTALFVKNQDFPILAIQCCCMVITIAANYLLIKEFQIAGAAYAAVLSATVLFAAKLLFWLLPVVRVQPATKLTT